MALIIPSQNALAFGRRQKKLELRVRLCDQRNMNNKERTPFDDLPESALRLLLSHLLQQNEELLRQVARQESELAELRRLLFGRKSERVEPVERKIRQKQEKPKEETQAAAQAKRKEQREKKQALEEVEQYTPLPDEKRVCPLCQGSEFHPLGTGQESIEYEYVPPRLLKIRHKREKKACSCGGYVVTAPSSPRVTEGTHYGPGLHAHVVVQKCADAIPLYRQEKILRRSGVELSRTTLKDLFHRCGDLLEPLYQKMLALITEEKNVNADETTIKVQKKGGCEKAWMWTFVIPQIRAFYFSSSRSGETPKLLLKNTQGTLQVDGYSGYNHVCVPEGRERVGCWAHVRRYFYKALESEKDVAEKALEQILSLYEVEYQAAEEGLLGTEKHLAMRQIESKEILRKWKLWLEEQESLHPPKSPMGAAIQYTKNNWESLEVFLKDPHLRLDNNISEQTLRAIAIGRKNYLFVGNQRAGRNLAVLQSLVSSCEINGVNPQAYLSDVLIRIQSHPHSRIDELLPHRWTPLPS